jgi:phosphoglycolate phosphatase-like HAD superfamily hydrolase
MLAEHGIENTASLELLQRLMETAQQSYLSNCPDTLVEKVCPGVTALLADLSERNIPLALVTGNLSLIGWKKMELAGLQHHFRLGAFAEHGKTRADLVAKALDDSARLGLTSPSTKISLIGDHPNDIRAARVNGIQAIATATGPCTIEELRAEGPDILVRDLTELEVRQLL